MSLAKSAVLLFLLAGSVAHSQQPIALDSATSARLGLVFQKVQSPMLGDGARFTATVIPSPFEATQVLALQSGVITAWQVKAGQVVVAGQVLGVMHSDEFAALQQQWIAAQIQAELDSKALARDKALVSDGIIAEQRLLNTEQSAKSSSFQLQALTRQLEQRGFAAADRAALARGELKAGAYLLKAPIAGKVTHLPYAVGATVAAHTAVVNMVGDKLWLSAEVPVRLAMQLAEEQALQLVDSNATLQIRQLDQALDVERQTLGVLAEFTSATALLPGQVVSVILPAVAAGVLVPAEAVVRNGEDRVVFVRNAGGVESRVLVLLPLGGDYLATTGLVPGEEVVVRGASVLKGITLGLGGE